MLTIGCVSVGSVSCCSGLFVKTQLLIKGCFSSVGFGSASCRSGNFYIFVKTELLVRKASEH